MESNDPSAEAALEEARVASVRSVLWLRQGSPQKAVIHAMKAYEITARVYGETHPQSAGLLYQVAVTEVQSGDYVSARRNFTTAAALLAGAAPEYLSTRAYCLTSLGELYILLDEFEAASDVLEEARRWYVEAAQTESAGFAIVLNDLGEVNRKLGRLAEARAWGEKALRIRRLVFEDPHVAIGQSLNNLALVVTEMGDHLRALELHHAALDVRTRALGPRHADVALSLANVGYSYLALGRPEQALPWIERAVEGVKATLGDRSVEYAIELGNRALCALMLGRAEEARGFVDQTLPIIEAATGLEGLELGRLLTLKATVELETGLHAAAISTMESARDRVDRAVGRRHRSYVDAVHGLGMACVRAGEVRRGLDELLGAEVARDQVIKEVLHLGSERQHEAYIGQALAGCHDVLSVLVACSRETADVVNCYALVLRRKAVLFGLRRALANVRFDDATAAGMLERLRAVRASIADAVLRGRTAHASPAAEALEEWGSEREELEKCLSEHMAKRPGRTVVPNDTPNDVLRALRADTLLIEVVRYDSVPAAWIPGEPPHEWGTPRYVAFLLRKLATTPVRVVDLGPATRIEKLVEDCREYLAQEGVRASRGSESTSQGRDRLTALRREVFDPLVAQDSDCRRIVFAPDGALCLIPLEVLPGQRQGLWMDEFEISYVGVGRDVLAPEQRNAAAREGPTVIGDPDYDLTASAPRRRTWAQGDEPSRANSWLADCRFQRLAGTAEEARVVASMMGVEPIVGASATRALFLRARGPNVLHVATHGFYVPATPRFVTTGLDLFGRMPGVIVAAATFDPLLRSGIALAGANALSAGFTPPEDAGVGVVTAEDVLYMDLRGTTLVCLSACETGLGDIRQGEGVVGLRQSFLLAGARVVVSSLWRVPDALTTELMRIFYSELSKGQPCRSAMQTARAGVRRHHPHPYCWGAFVCYGDVDACLT
jgi:CHAT domain-containing protein/tetratricopeptide (TPR) repeat protein